MITYLSGPIFPRAHPNPMYRFFLFLMADFSFDSTFLLTETEPNGVKSHNINQLYNRLRNQDRKHA